MCQNSKSRLERFITPLTSPFWPILWTFHKANGNKKCQYQILWFQGSLVKNLKILTDHENMQKNWNCLSTFKNWLKRRKNRLLRVMPQNNFGIRNFEIFSTILPMGIFNNFLSTKQNVHKVTKLLKWDTLRNFYLWTFIS